MMTSHQDTDGSRFELSEVRKTLITALGMVVAVGTYVLHNTVGFLPEGWATGISIGIGVATIVLNYLAPNETDSAERAVNRSVRLRQQPKHRAARASSRPPTRSRRAKTRRRNQADDPVA
ncbi:membrane protein [Mycobacterium phage Saguaro]|uniref:Membrane protein n=1 Tax=Mycobacterium phage Saguaro TaxID=2315616 RepID=A0A386KB49_9CAUD|nr:membrane protein [Mycobacterium phage Saguaro]AYD82012.1 membrane protein [Mycobacterium phage Saguaro]